MLKYAYFSSKIKGILYVQNHSGLLQQEWNGCGSKPPSSVSAHNILKGCYICSFFTIRLRWKGPCCLCFADF